ncbi:MAG: hypothetical protein ACFWT6_10520 [Virgibacillus proomii]
MNQTGGITKFETYLWICYAIFSEKLFLGIRMPLAISK